MGGTEIFVSRLIDAQLKRAPSIDVLWAAHRKSEVEGPGASLTSIQLTLPPVRLSGRKDSFAAMAGAIPGFEDLLQDFRPDVVHLHSFSPHCGINHARAVKAAGARLVVTVHSPGFSCTRGTLIDMNGAVCDGRLRPRRCTSCRLQSGGLPRALAAAASIQRGFMLSSEHPGRLSHVLTFRRLVESFHASWREFAALADAIHVNARWMQNVLLGQEIPRQKLHLVRIAGPAPLSPKRRKPLADGTLRLVYWGRCEEYKGIHLVLDAIRALSAEVPVSLDISTTGWDQPYGRDLLRRMEGDPRIVRRPPLPQGEMLPALQDYDLAVVPSIWLETGPLTVLEAFAAGLSVAGSPLGGIPELLDGVQGTFLVPPRSASWKVFIEQVLQDPSCLSQFVPPAPRTFDDVASELHDVAYVVRG